MRAISGEEIKNITTRILYITFGNRFRTRRFSDATFYLRGVSSYFVSRFCAIVRQSFTQYRGRIFFLCIITVTPSWFIRSEIFQRRWKPGNFA